MTMTPYHTSHITLNSVIFPLTGITILYYGQTVRQSVHNIINLLVNSVHWESKMAQKVSSLNLPFLSTVVLLLGQEDKLGFLRLWMDTSGIADHSPAVRYLWPPFKPLATS